MLGAWLWAAAGRSPAAGTRRPRTRRSSSPRSCCSGPGAGGRGPRQRGVRTPGVRAALAVERMARLSAERDRTSRRDPLTDLANRTGLQAAFADRPAATTRTDLPVAMLLLDLNRFKYVNDALGHEVGDRLLIAVGQSTAGRGAAGRHRGPARRRRVRGSWRRPERRDRGAAPRRASSCDAMTTPVMLDGLQVDITGSIGIAVSPRPRHRLRHRDAARRRRDVPGEAARHAVARRTAPEDDHNSPERLALLTDFRRALDAAAGRSRCTTSRRSTSPPTGSSASRHCCAGSTRRRRRCRRAELLRIAEHTPVMQMITNG